MKKLAARLGIGEPVSIGKTALLECLVPLFIKKGLKVAIVTNDLLTTEDANRLKNQGIFPQKELSE